MLLALVLDLFRKHWVIRGKGGVPDWVSWEIRSASSPIPSAFNRRSDLRFVSSSASMSLEAVELDDISDSMECCFYSFFFRYFSFLTAHNRGGPAGK